MSSANELKNLGNSQVSSGNYSDAIESYSKAIEMEPANHIFYSNRSAAYLALENTQKALDDAEKCVQLNEKWVKGYTRKAAALHQMKDYQQACDCYQQGLDIEPNNQVCLDGLKECQNLLNRNTANPLAGAFGSDMFAKLAMSPRCRNFLQDPVFVQKLQSIQQDSSKLNEHLGDQRMMTCMMELMGMGDMMSRKAGEPDEINEKNFSKNTNTTSCPPKKETVPEPEPIDENLTPEELELKKKKTSAEKFKSDGNSFYKSKEFEKAIECYDKAIEIDPDNMSFISNRAAVRFEMGNLDECIKDCNEAIKVGRENRADYALIAKAYVRIGNAHLKLANDKNENALQAAIEAFENAQVENRTKEVDQKIKKTNIILKKAKELSYIDPEKAMEEKTAGNEKFKGGDFPGAIAHYDEAIKRDPSNPVYYTNRAVALTKLTSFADAKRDCDKALALDPTYVKAYSRKGAIEFFMKEYHKSMETYQKGLSLDPNNDECRDGLNRVTAKIHESSRSGEVDQERAAHGMADPEIQAILRDPVMQNVLSDFQADPRSAQKHLQNPGIMAKIEKLIAAGVLQTK